ncbi:GntR family transcriptional regulator [Bordetella genomosp. 9]|uniref:GntR family transcriptional regulator n=1 Tax=Bordetella genomosp. 9 TaxID=1416803 RepID=UPI001E3A5924|nr:GntR family transcriptional regulator [Bordetella genomosp. 9]
MEQMILSNARASMDIKPPATIPFVLYERIRQMIIDGTLAPGQPLREQELERRFGTSRSPIREALRLLQLNGLATHQQRRGFRVVLYTEREIAQIYLLRGELESYAMREVARCDDVEPLLSSLRDACERLAARDPLRDAASHLSIMRDAFLHIVEFVQNPPLAEAVKRLNERCEPLRYNLSRQGADVGALAGYLRRILQALERRDFDGAAAARRECARWILPLVVRAYAAQLNDAQPAR